MSVRPSDLRHPIAIEAPTETPDGQGGFTRTFSTLFTAYGFIEPMSAMERILGMRRQVETTHKISIRYRRDVTIPGDARVSYTVNGSTRLFQVQGILNDGERNRTWVLLCKEGVAS